MNDITDIAEVYDLLYRLGFSATNTAFFQLSYAVYHNFGTPLIGSVFLSNHILPRFEFLGKWRMPLPFLLYKENHRQCRWFQRALAIPIKNTRATRATSLESGR